MPLEHINLARERANANGSSQDEAEKFTATPEELRAIQDKMKDPKFVELMHEYMQSLEDPETRREEEACLAQAEREAREGGDFSFEFVFPRPAFAVELLEPSNTTVPASEMKKLGVSVGATAAGATAAKPYKARSFLNICTSDKIKAFTEHTTGNPNGSNWEVPVSVSQRRTEVYKPVPSAPSASILPEYASLESAAAVCVVHDVVLHPNTVSLAERSPRFMCFLVEIAVEHINSGYKESNNFPFRRLPSSVASIGTPQNQTIRSSGPGKSPFDVDPHAPVLTRPTKHLPTGKANTATPSGGSNSRSTTNATRIKASPAATAASTQSTTKAAVQAPPSASALVTKSTTAAAASSTGGVAAPATRLPPYTIAHRGSIDLSDAWQWRVSDKRVGVPSELVVKLTFDGVRRAAMLDIAITPDGQALRIDPTEGQRVYEGLLVLPFTVEEEPRQAQFDCARGVLTLTLAVVPPPLPDGATTAEELRRELQGGAAVLSDPEADQREERAAEHSTHADSRGAGATPVAAAPSPPSSPTESSAAAAVPPTSTAPAVLPGSSSTHGPEVSHIGDQDRVAAMMAQVRAAREAREAAAAAAAAAEENQATTAAEQGGDKQADPTTAPAAEVRHAPAATNIEEARMPAVSEDEAIPLIRKAPAAAAPHTEDDSPSVHDGVAAVQNRQQAWAAMIAAEMEAARHREEADAARAAQETEAQAARARRKVAVEQEQERQADRAKAKRDALPLSNKYIFAID